MQCTIFAYFASPSSFLFSPSFFHLCIPLSRRLVQKRNTRGKGKKSRAICPRAKQPPPSVHVLQLSRITGGKFRFLLRHARRQRGRARQVEGKLVTTVCRRSYKRWRKEKASQSTVNFITSNRVSCERLGEEVLRDDITSANKTLQLREGGGGGESSTHRGGNLAVSQQRAGVVLELLETSKCIKDGVPRSRVHKVTEAKSRNSVISSPG